MTYRYYIAFRWQTNANDRITWQGNRTRSVWPKLFATRAEAQAVIDECRDIFINLRNTKRKLSVSVDCVVTP